jgi:DNA mismatch endonuclease (patch repair protein)
VILVHGCFWHGHHCPMFKRPATRTNFWMTKIGRNQERDSEAIAALKAAGWRVLVAWECAMRGLASRPLREVISQCESFLRDQDREEDSISGSRGPPADRLAAHRSGA